MKSKIDYNEIIKLIDLLEERKLSHFELEVEGLKISLGRGQAGTQPLEMVQIAPPAADASKIPLPTEAAQEEPQNNLHVVTSPMVGTFYRSPDPSSPAFVEAGETVKKNQTLCIIEAMKLMNEIEADVEGVVTEVYVKNGKPVEYGQKLFALKPL